MMSHPGVALRAALIQKEAVGHHVALDGRALTCNPWWSTGLSSRWWCALASAQLRSRPAACCLAAASRAAAASLAAASRAAASLAAASLAAASLASASLARFSLSRRGCFFHLISCHLRHRHFDDVEITM